MAPPNQITLSLMSLISPQEKKTPPMRMYIYSVLTVTAVFNAAMLSVHSSPL